MTHSANLDPAVARALRPPRTATPAAVSFVTTEHFTLQSPRSATIAESTARATMFLGSVSAGLIALGLIATASDVGAAFDAVALVIIPTLALVGLMTFGRVLQRGIEDLGYASRIARVRAYYFDVAPDLDNYLFSTEPAERLHILGLWQGRLQGLRTVAGTVATLTAVLIGSAAGLAATLLAEHSLAFGLATGGGVAFFAFTTLMRYQRTVWRRAHERITSRPPGPAEAVA